MDKSKFNNVATVVGKVNRKEMKDVGDYGLGEVYVNADGNSIKFQKWNNENNDAQKVFDELDNGVLYQLQGNMGERHHDGNTYREIRVWNNIKEIIGEEKAVLALSGDVFDIDMSYPIEVPGFEYNDEAVPKLEMKILYFNTYNTDSGEEDLTREEVLINQIQRYGDKCKKKDIPFEPDKLKNMMERLESMPGIETVFEVYKEAKQANVDMYQITELTATALGDVAEDMSQKIEKGDNVTLGCFIENRMTYTPVKRDYFGIAEEEQEENNNQGGENINRLRVGKYKINEKVLAKSSQSNGGW